MTAIEQALKAALDRMEREDERVTNQLRIKREAEAIRKQLGVVYGANLHFELSTSYCDMEHIEATLCNYIVGDEPEASNETIDDLMNSIDRHLWRVMFECRSAGMVGTLSADDIPGFVDSPEDAEDPLSGAVRSVLDTMQPLLRRIAELVEARPTDPDTLNAKLLAIDHLAALTVDRIEKCREAAAA